MSDIAQGQVTMTPPIPSTDLGPTPASPLPELPGHTSRGRLERVLRRGEFAITAELNPPDSANPDDVYERVKHFDGFVDGVNATDGSGANCHMSSVAICALLTRVGYSPILQISCRDYNRIAIQGNVLGAAGASGGTVTTAFTMVGGLDGGRRAEGHAVVRREYAVDAGISREQRPHHLASIVVQVVPGA